MKPASVPIRRALLSVSDKTGLVELARALVQRNIEILSTGGSARLLAENAMRFQIATNFARGDISSIKMAIQDGK